MSYEVKHRPPIYYEEIAIGATGQVFVAVADLTYVHVTQEAELAADGVLRAPLHGKISSRIHEIMTQLVTAEW